MNYQLIHRIGNINPNSFDDDVAKFLKELQEKNNTLFSVKIIINEDSNVDEVDVEYWDGSFKTSVSYEDNKFRFAHIEANERTETFDWSVDNYNGFLNKFSYTYHLHLNYLEKKSKMFEEYEKEFDNIHEVEYLK